MSANDKLHGGQPVLTAGVPAAQARVGVVLVHGRGASASDMLTLAAEFNQPAAAYWAPQAANRTWYPYRFMEPLEANEPWLSSALDKVGAVLAQVAAAGRPPEKTVLLGFSQGACLATEYVARHAQRYGGVVGLSGGLLGPDETPRDYPGSLAGTPVFLGCSDVDPHIPAARVEHSAAVLRKLGGAVTARLYHNMAHTVNSDEVRWVQALLAELTG
ncbi:MAG: alpha/beta fold hydrolase [Anaerolineales bacterium]|nr:alpha/beta fold hydrolase [Anaerolineales bacterium]